MRGKCRKIFIRYAHMFAGCRSRLGSFRFNQERKKDENDEDDDDDDDDDRGQIHTCMCMYVCTLRVHEKVEGRKEKELEEEIRYIDMGSAGTSYT